MKNIFRISGVILLILSIILIHSCKKDKPSIPTLTTNEVTDINATEAFSGGTISDEGSSTVSVRGVCWSTENTPTISDKKTNDGIGPGSYRSIITGLDGATVYYVRAFAINGVGTGYGNVLSFTTKGQLPSATIVEATNIGGSVATLNGIVNPNYLMTTVTYEYGTTTSYGTTATPTNNILTSSTETNVSANITGLTVATQYHYRLKVVNSIGTAYSGDMTFTTENSEMRFNSNLTYGTVTDIDGNEYKTITIGAQTWMAENLKTSKYSNDTDIQYVNTVSEWDALAKDSKAYCWNFDNINNKNIYGALYTWTAAMNGASSSSSNPSGVQGVCPTGWHLPSDAEWHSLVLTLDPNSNLTANPESSIAGGKMKETGTFHWKSPNTDATNESGFTALPGNLRDTFGKFTDITFAGQEGFWWSSTIYNTEMAYHRSIYYLFGNFRRGDYYYQSGMSVRCLKDY